VRVDSENSKIPVFLWWPRRYVRIQLSIDVLYTLVRVKVHTHARKYVFQVLYKCTYVFYVHTYICMYVFMYVCMYVEERGGGRELATVVGTVRDDCVAEPE
jgi:hypothetical protein